MASGTVKRVWLGDVCSAKTSAIKLSDIANKTGTYPVFGAAGFIRNIDFYTQEQECVGLVKDGAGVGRAIKLPPCSSVIGTMMYIIPNENVFCGYLYYLLSGLHLSDLHTGATIPHLYFKDFNNKIIPLPSIVEQKRIAAVLDKIGEMKRNAEARLQKLDLLVKARFNEMFGEPTTNSKGWQNTILSNHIKFLTSGSRGWAKYYSEAGEYFITIKNVKDTHISIDDVQHICPPSGAEAKRTRVQEGDLLISITADLGRTGIVTKEIANHGAYINQHLICIRLKRDHVLPLFVAFYMESLAGKVQFQRKNQSAVKAGLNFAAIRSFSFYLPPLALQREFATFVEKVEALKATIKKELTQVDLLYRSKLQEYFG